ncbi:MULTISPECIES: peptide chain release factor N(5)-glutamine methyltransferase [Alphaproteobacteria]|uniref:Release factor glutamine methyltransferase n=2 Tax=Alphaproteobacteria TaxID=28211 RepID=A0A512HLN5_9HYPH|nr:MULTISPECIES: peptide chain release factor N(5)-glutamine methyltransferase [Alphaproteobacteria]GEO86366.1 release factor glutamine methyltransferase [Ciceribacter naphthalenivorans]GLR21848.1 release factor glutamine methyltransferase [Ciceribacter naphthalenivorans]GLT04704.1 release factor glutamine methyltransferase [Sphingomonas psychrolutea]
MSGASRLGAVVAATRNTLAEAGFVDAAIETRILLGGLLGLSTTEVFTQADRPVTEAERALILDAVARRLRHEPVHRILGYREFHGLDLRLSPETLEPRPDTEILVDCLLPHLKRIAAENGSVSLLDMGTGTGAIALALLKECPQARALGSDIALGALETAANNADLNGLADRFETRRSAWFEAIDGRFDIIVSNPPYIPTDVVEALDPEVRDYDPRAALDGGGDGLVAYRAIAENAAQHLLSHGLIGVEIGYDQRESVTQLFERKGFSLIEWHRDLGGNDRVLLFSRDG